MGEFDESVRTALRDRAEGRVLVEALLVGARRRGVRRRRVHRVLLGSGTAAVMAVVMFLATPGGGGTHWIFAEIQDGSWLTRPPKAERGEQNTLRLDVADRDVYQLQWFTDGDLQRLFVQRVGAESGISSYVVSRGPTENGLQELVLENGLRGTSSEQVMVGADLGTYTTDDDRSAFLRWRRPDGTWLGVSVIFAAGTERVRMRAAILELAQGVLADVALRCVADFRLDWIPDGSRTVGCLLTISPKYRSYGLRLITGDGITFWASTTPASNVLRLEPNASIGERMVDLDADSGRYLTGNRVFAVQSGSGLSADNRLKVIGGFTPLGDPIP